MGWRKYIISNGKYIEGDNVDVKGINTIISIKRKFPFLNTPRISCTIRMVNGTLKLLYLSQAYQFYSFKKEWLEK